MVILLLIHCRGPFVSNGAELRRVIASCKQSLDSVFVISRIMKVAVRVINLQPSSSVENPNRVLHYSGNKESV